MTDVTGLPTAPIVSPDDICDSLVDISETTPNPAGKSSKAKIWDLVSLARGGFTANNNTINTVISAINTPVKVEGITDPSAHLKFFTHANNRLTWNHSETVILDVESWASIDKAAGSGYRDFRIHLFKNGAALATPLSSRLVLNTNGERFAMVGGFIELAQNEYIELWVESNEGSDNIRAVTFGMKARI